jgi:VWFA-related protein
MPSRRSPFRLAVAVAGIVLGTLATAAPAQDERPGVFGEVLDVRVVNLEVVVTDRDGARVRGLLPQDFELTVDGQAVPIDFFTEVVGGTVAPAGSGTAAVPGTVPGTAVGTNWLVFVDDFFSIGRERDEVLEALAGQLGFLSPHDRMAVVAWDGRRLAMLTSWSGSQPALERALGEAQKRPAHGLERLVERRSLDSDRTLTGRAGRVDRRGFGRVDQLEIDERHFVEQLAAQVERSTGAAAATLRAFANPPGRKAMLLLSGGWPWNPADYLVDRRGRMILDDTPEGEDLFQPLVDTANLLGYTLYPVDVPGVSEAFSSDASRGVPADGGLDSDREQELHASLAHLASSTGGREMLNSQRLTVLETAVEDTRSYYWLGFTPQRQGDDAPHEVEVSVRRPGLRVRNREGFRDLSRQAEMSMAVESALLFGNPPSSLPLALTLGAPERAGRRLRVPIEVTVPVGELTALPVGEEWVTTAELRIAAQDDAGDTAPIPVVPLELRLAAAPTPGQVARFRTVLELRRAAHDIVVALYEPTSGKVFSAAARITP